MRAPTVSNSSITIHTVKAAKSHPSKDAYYWDLRLRGFGLRVTPKGVKSYVLQYRVRGCAARRKTIGVHGSPWTPHTARIEAERLLEQVKHGIDPVENVREAKRREKVLNFSAYCDNFVELYLRTHWSKTWPEAMRVLENIAKPRWGKRGLNTLTRSDMVKLMDDYANRPGMRKHTHSILRTLFNWAVDRGDIEISPLAGMRAPRAVPSRQRVLSHEEVICLWRASEEVAWLWGPFVRLLLLTMQRRLEVAEMDWAEIDLNARSWTLPGKRAKNGQPHVVPLTRLTIRELEALGPRESGLVFSSTGRTPISGISKAKTALDNSMRKFMRQRAAERGCDPDGVPWEDWRLHDLRRTGTTNLQALGVPIEVTESVLNHISGTRAGVAGVYNLYNYFPEKQAALQSWDRRLSDLLVPAMGQSATSGRGDQSIRPAQRYRPPGLGADDQLTLPYARRGDCPFVSTRCLQHVHERRAI
ncbi:MAG: site-specific integrase [Novosphingobium sp.]